jgi:hypothetical protein
MTTTHNSISQILFQTIQKEKDLNHKEQSYLNKSLSQVFGFDPKIQTIYSQNKNNDNEIGNLNSKKRKRSDTESITEGNLEQPPSKIQKHIKKKKANDQKVMLMRDRTKR